METLAVILHEGFHQYLFYAYGMKETPVWFNEGHACLFEAAEVSNQGKVELPENAMRARLLLVDLDAAAARIPELLRMSYAQFYGGDDAARNLNYATAWGLVYYLRKGVPTERNSPAAQVLETYAAALAAGSSPEQAATAAFAGVDPARLQHAFTTFWKKGRSEARRYDPLK